MRELAHELRKVAQFDYLAVLLYDPAQHRLVARVLDPDVHADEASRIMASIDGSPAGHVWLTQQALVIPDMQSEQRWPDFYNQVRHFGVISSCELPLTTSRCKLGTLVFASKKPNEFNDQNVEFLQLIANHVAIAIENALAFQEIATLKEQLEQEVAYLEEELLSDHNFGEIVGESQALRQVLKLVETVASTDATVLIRGETGTGKELVARALHNLSSRQSRPFIKLNCAAIPTGLLESELFGHEKGAFTGAINHKIGRFELADGGTIFLDEIGDIPAELQPKLLRVLQEQEFERIGGTKTIKVNVRLVSATHRDLQSMANRGEFRSDLFYRLNVFPVTLPPLRERPDDIPALVQHFTRLFSSRMGRTIESIPSSVVEHLSKYSWPGNIRELQNVIERAVILSPGKVLHVPLNDLQLDTAINRASTNGHSAHVPSISSQIKSPSGSETYTDRDSQIDSYPQSLNPTLADAERTHILSALERSRWVIGGVNGAASLLGLKRTTLQKKMKKLGIERPS